MLCYQSSRSVGNLLHDVFRWFVDNRHAMLAIIVPVLPICVYTSLISGYTYETETRTLSFIDEFGRRPLDVSLSYAILAFVTAFFAVPVIRRYFYIRRAVAGATVRSVFKWTGDALMPSLAVAGAFAVCEFFYCEFGGVGILLFVIIMYIAPLVIMSTRAVNIKDNVTKFLLGSLVTIIMFMFVQIFPIYCIELLQAIAYYLTQGMSGMKFEWLQSDILISLLLSLAYCLSVVLLLIASVLLHGSMVTTNNEEQQ